MTDITQPLETMLLWGSVIAAGVAVAVILHAGARAIMPVLVGILVRLRVIR